jgi:putative membrane protein
VKNLKHLSIAFAVLGLMSGTLLVGWYGFGKVANATLSAGGTGFAVLCAWQLLLFAILGLAWRAIAPLKRGPRLGPFVWGRMVRDAASSCLPFSQVGGFVLGARAATLHGIPWPVATVSTIVDLTAEFLAEIAFAMGGLLILLARSSDTALLVPIVIGLAAAAIVGGAILHLQRRIAPLFVRLGRRVLGELFDGGREGAANSQEELAAAYGHTGRLALGTAIHLLGWFGKGVGNWIAFHLLGANLDLMGGLAIEAILHAMLAVAFLVPGYAGVQEAGYAALGGLFGIPAEISIGVSLLRRARDLAVGIPILLIWQLFEIRRLRIVPPI